MLFSSFFNYFNPLYLSLQKSLIICMKNGVKVLLINTFTPKNGVIEKQANREKQALKQKYEQ